MAGSESFYTELNTNYGWQEECSKTSGLLGAAVVFLLQEDKQCYSHLLPVNRTITMNKVMMTPAVIPDNLIFLLDQTDLSLHKHQS